jgi:hypothetical protein
MKELAMPPFKDQAMEILRQLTMAQTNIHIALIMSLHKNQSAELIKRELNGAAGATATAYGMLREINK